MRTDEDLQESRIDGHARWIYTPSGESVRAGLYSGSSRPLPGDLLDRLRSGGRDLTILVVRLWSPGGRAPNGPLPVRLIRAALPEAGDSLDRGRSRGPACFEGHADLNAVFPLPRESSRAAGSTDRRRSSPRFSAGPDGFAGSARTWPSISTATSGAG